MYTSDNSMRLGVGLLLSVLRLNVWPDTHADSAMSDDQLEQLLRLEAPVGSAVDISLYSGYLLVGDVPFFELGASRSPFSLTLRCEPERFRLRIDVMPLEHYDENNTIMSNTVTASNICNRHNKIVMQPSPIDRFENVFHGCIGNITLGSHHLLTSLCRSEKVKGSKSFVRSVTSAATTLNREDAVDLIQIGEHVKVRENSSTRLLFKHVYLTPGHKQLGITNYTLVKFDIVTQPEHGRLTMLGSDSAAVHLSSFTYADVLERRIEYIHDGSETVEDSFDFRIKVEMLHVELRKDQLVCLWTIFIDIEAVDDAPQLRAGVHGTVVQMAPGGRVRLSELNLQVWDADTMARDVWIRVRRINGAFILDTLVRRLTRFSQAQLLNGEVFLASEDGDGEVEFCVIVQNNCNAEPNASLTLRITPVVVLISLVANTGLAIPHCSSGIISPQNLSFSSNFNSSLLRLRYVVVDQPKFGVLECLRGSSAESDAPSWSKFAVDTYQICAQFDQGDVENFRVRYRHTSDSRPQSDTIGFQIHCGETKTRVHIFHVNFIAVRFHVFTRIPFLLNATQEEYLSANNLLATAFPKGFMPVDILYHVVEPPKFGMLSRRIETSGAARTSALPKFRRIGVSSNFTQEQVNAGAIQYKLHYVQYSPLRDYFVYRLITAAATSELMRFEIAYLPGAHSLSLINRTLIVTEGAAQKITNSTLWLETPDETYFLFILSVAPFNGQLTLTNRTGSTIVLTTGSTFTSSDISKNRLFYEHTGDETRSDRMRLIAENVSEQQEMRFSFWLSVSIIAVDDNAPHLRRRYDAEGRSIAMAVITLIDESERVLQPSLLPWSDSDWTDRVGSGVSVLDSRPLLSFHVAELFRDFIICTRDAPELSVRNFTSRQLEERSLIVRHLNLKKNSNKLRYTVSDGKHTVNSTLRFVASAPFIRLNANRIFVPRNFTTTTGQRRRFVLLTSAHLAAETNLDTDPDIIGFERLHSQDETTSPFRLIDESDGSLRVINAFKQRDIFARRIFLVLQVFSTLTVPLRISAINDASSTSMSSRFPFFGFASREMSRPFAPMKLTSDVVFTVQIVDDSDTITSEIAANTVVMTLPGAENSNNGAIECAVESAVAIDANLFTVSPIWWRTVNVFNAKYFIVEPPRYGVFAISWRNSSVTNTESHIVDGFRQSDIDIGRLRYVSLNASADRDAFVVRVSLPRKVLSDDGDTNIIGPLRINIRLVDFSQMLLVPSRSLSVKPGDNLTLHATDLRLSVPSDSDITTSALEYRVMRAPSARQQAHVGYLAIRNEKNGALVVVQNAFRHAELINGQVFVIAHPLVDDNTFNADSAELEWELRACSSFIRQAKCSANAKLRIVIDTGNSYAPTLVRNEPLAFTASVDKMTLANSYLCATDRDTPPAGLKYLVWHVNGGTLRKMSVLKGEEKGEDSDALTSFTQADIDAERIEFFLDEGVKKLEDVEGRVNFHFLVTDARHQTLPAVFSLTRRRKKSSKVMTEKIKGKKPTVTLETNAHLDAAPGIRANITNATLSTHILGIQPEDIIFQVRRLPLHGRLNIDKSIGPVSTFTQADLDAERITYASPADQGAWSQRDAFDFFVTTRHSVVEDNEIFTYRIHSSFANLREEDLPQFVIRQDVVVSNGGSVMVNASHLNLTRLSALCDDVLLLRVAGEPRCGRLSRLREFTSINDSSNANDDEGEVSSVRLTLYASEIESGRDIIYRHDSTEPNCQTANADEIVLRVYAFREKYRPADSLRVVIRIHVTHENIDDTVERFPERLDVVWGGRIILAADRFRVMSSNAIETSQLTYHLIQPLVGDLRLMHIGKDLSSSKLVNAFTQFDVDQGAIALEHFVGDKVNGDVLQATEINVLVFRIGKSNATRVLPVRIKPLALQLVNHSDIALVQSKTYVVLNQTHLGATSNGDRTRIVYKVTRPPVNGSLYWVASDTQARVFSQKNIDDGEIVYAQLNMNAFQDSFGFVLSNDETETVEREARVIVTAIMPLPLSFVTTARTITQISAVHLNTSHIPYASVRFFIVHPPKFGRLFLRADVNASASFFTAADIADGNLFFHAFNVNRREIDQIELEMIGKNIQPARLSWMIDVRPSDGTDNDEGFRFPAHFANVPIDNILTKMANNSSVRPPEINYRFPIFILVSMVSVIIAMVLCQWRNASSTEDKRHPTSTNKVNTCGRSSSHNSDGSGSDQAIIGISPLRPLPNLVELTTPNASASITHVTPPAKAPRGILTNASRLPGTIVPTTVGRTDLLKSTVYARIGSPNNYKREVLEGSGGDERVADVRRCVPKLSKSVTLADDVELSDDDDTQITQIDTSAARNAPCTAAVRSMIGSSTRRRSILPSVDERCGTTNSAITPLSSNMVHSDEFDAFGQGYYDVSSRATQNVSSLVAFNPVKCRSILPRQPISVSSVVPSNLTTFDSFETMAHVKTSTFYPGDNDDADFPDVISPLLSPTTIADTLPFIHAPSSQARLQKQTQLTAAAATNCGRSSSSTSSVTISDLPMSSKARETITPLKENEYWV